MRFWAVVSREARWDGTQEVLVTAESPERAIEVAANTFNLPWDKQHWSNPDNVSCEELFPEEEGVFHSFFQMG